MITSSFSGPIIVQVNLRVRVRCSVVGVQIQVLNVNVNVNVQGSMNIYVRYDNYLVGSQGLYKVAQTIQGFLTGQGQAKLAENLLAHRFKEDVSIHTVPF